MIRLVDVERFYQAGPTRTYVLRRINLEIREGEFLTIMGPSGAGKSTLLSILGLLDHSWSGGDAAFAYNDPRPPAATELLGEFVEGGLRIA